VFQTDDSKGAANRSDSFDSNAVVVDLEIGAAGDELVNEDSGSLKGSLLSSDAQEGVSAM
jgi:hypothetical protein